MEPWQTRYKDKLISAAAAAKLVKSGDLVRLHIGTPPIPILDALAKRKGEVENVTVIQCYPLNTHPIWNEPLSGEASRPDVALRDAVAADIQLSGQGIWQQAAIGRQDIALGMGDGFSDR